MGISSALFDNFTLALSAASRPPSGGKVKEEHKGGRGGKQGADTGQLRPPLRQRLLLRIDRAGELVRNYFRGVIDVANPTHGNDCHALLAQIVLHRVGSPVAVVSAIEDVLIHVDPDQRLSRLWLKHLTKTSGSLRERWGGGVE